MKATALFTLSALSTLAAAMAMPAQAEEKKEEKRSIVIKIDGKDMSIPEAATHAVDKAMAALDSALASKELATPPCTAMMTKRPSSARHSTSRAT